MSTKVSFLYAEGLHFYQDCAEDTDSVYIETDDNAEIVIPAHIWEAVRRCPAVDLSLASKTDEEIALDVEEFVADRIVDCKGKLDGLVGAMGLLSYGSTANEPIRDQIRKGIRSRKAERTRRQEIKRKRDELMKELGPRLRIIKIGGDE